MELKPIQYPIQFLRDEWPKIGDKLMNGFVPDSVSRIVAEFNSGLRYEHYSTLLHTPNKGLLLGGPKGIGKTINMRIISKIVSTDPNKNRMPRLISVKEIQNKYRELQESKEGAQFINELINCPELIIDDIGSEDFKFNDFGTIKNLISDIIFGRYPLFQRGLCITHGTTNLNSKTLESLYDVRLMDRMKEMFVFKIARGESKRTNPIKEIKPVETSKPVSSEITQIENLKALNFFKDAILNDEGVIPTPIINKMVSYTSVDWDLLHLREQAQKSIKLGKYMTEFQAAILLTESENEIEKIMKTIALREYFKTNEVDFTKL